MTSNIEITSSDEGLEIAPVTFQGSPYGVTFDRNNPSLAYGWFLDHCNYITITTATDHAFPAYPGPQTWMEIKGAWIGVFVYYSDHIVASRLKIASNSFRGIDSIRSSHGQFTNNIVMDNGYYGVRVSYSDYANLENNTILGHDDLQLSVESSRYNTFRSNIICSDGSGNIGIRVSNASGLSESDFNLIFATNEAYIGNFADTPAITLMDWQTISGLDANSISSDPGFVDRAGADLHLSSIRGSYHSGQWSSDTFGSIGIDAGALDALYTKEPGPNGDRINLGAFGGTEQASKTLADGVDFDSDGLQDILEVYSRSNPDDADSDDDGIIDGVEDANHNGVVDAGETKPYDSDSDGDGIQDGTELGLGSGVADPDGGGPLLGTNTGIFVPDADPTTSTDPTNADSDGDGYEDGQEDLNFNGMIDPGETDPNDELNYPINCMFDNDADGDVDGNDLYNFINSGTITNLSIFLNEYGSINCN